MPGPVISTPVIYSPIVDDLREEFERELPREPSVYADCDSDLANDVALDRGGRNLIVDGAGRSSGMSLCPGSNFERILSDFRIECCYWFSEEACNAVLVSK